MVKTKDIFKILIISLICSFFILGYSGFNVINAAGLEDENQTKLQQATGVDTDGDVFNIEDDDSGKVQTNGISTYSRAVSDKIVNFRTKGNAVTNYTEVTTGVSGYTNGAYGADAAYLGTNSSGTKVKFMLSGVVGWVNKSDVQVINFSSAKSSSCYKVSGGRLIHYITCDMTTPGHATSLDNGAAPSYLKSGTTYYSYDGHYFYTSYSTMLADYRNNTRSNAVNKSNPYYNYFQYLPLRSKTSYSSTSLNTLVNNKISSYTSSSSKMKSTASSFVKYQNTYGVNALLAVGVAGNESAWGTSSICKNKNNLFGLNAVDSSPGASANTYSSVDNCIKQFDQYYMSKGYLNPSDWRMKGGFLGNKGSGINVSYASDPYWGEKAANMAYTLDKNGGRKDEGKYTIGIKDTINTTHNKVNVRNGASTSTGKIIYNTDSYSNYAFIILNKTTTNSFYKIQSEPALNSSRTAISSSGVYDFDKMYLYISSSYVKVVNNGSATVSQSKSLSSISISTPPTKTAYKTGEKFSASGMVVKAKFSDGTSKDVTKNVTYSTSSLKAGTTSIKISYTYNGVTKSITQKITVKDPATVSKVKVSPSKISLTQGNTKTFAVSITGTGNPSQSVKWSVSGQNSTSTKISSTGLLTVSSKETAKTLTVKAVSTVDSTKSATATITVLKKASTTTQTGEDNGVENNEPEKEDSTITNTGSSSQTGGSNVDENLNNDNSENINKDENESLEKIELKDKESGITVNGMLPSNTELKVEEIDKDSKDFDYDKLISEVKDNTILGVYDITLSNELEDGEKVDLSFKVDEKYNGEDVIILHITKKDDETFTQTFKEKVEDGIVTIEVDGFSPYVFSLDDKKVVNDDNTGDVDDNKNNIDKEQTTLNDAEVTYQDSVGTSDDDNNVSKSTKTAKSTTENTNTQQSYESVNTADENNFTLWSVVFLVSAVASLGLGFILIKENKIS